jgi:hypothetical protein
MVSNTLLWPRIMASHSPGFKNQERDRESSSSRRRRRVADGGGKEHCSCSCRQAGLQHKSSSLTKTNEAGSMQCNACMTRPKVRNCCSTAPATPKKKEALVVTPSWARTGGCAATRLERGAEPLHLQPFHPRGPSPSARPEDHVTVLGS